MQPDFLLPAGAPALIFDMHDQQRAYDTLGANCGPGAIAGICGTTPEHAARILGPKLRKIGGTTEIMLRAALRELGVSWKEAPAGPAHYGICRVQWDGPWLQDPDPFKKLRHSHWIGMSGGHGSQPLVFDINAISQGGWITLEEWDAHLRPWLLATCEPQATGAWELTETLEIPLPQPAIPIRRTPM